MFSLENMKIHHIQGPLIVQYVGMDPLHPPYFFF